MTKPNLLSKSDAVADVGALVNYISAKSAKLGWNSLHTLKIILFDATVALNKLPFGNWISVVYFIVAASAIKNVIEGGELARLANRTIQVYFIERQNAEVLVQRFNSYLYRNTQTLLYNTATWLWGHSGEKVKIGVSKFAKEVVMENADEIERRAIELVKGAALSAIIATATQNLASEMGSMSFGTCDRMETAIEYLTYDMQAVSSQLDNVMWTNEIHNDELVAKINAVSLQLEYLRANQPDQFRAILTAISSTIPLSVIEALFPYSTRQTGRNRINII